MSRALSSATRLKRLNLFSICVLLLANIVYMRRTYKKLQSKSAVDRSFSELDTSLQKRSDSKPTSFLIPKKSPVVSFL